MCITSFVTKCFIFYGFYKNTPTLTEKYNIQLLFSIFQTLSVEYFHLDEKGASNDEMKRFMLSQGYQFHSKVTAPKNHANDYIFVKNDLFE